VAHGWEDDGWRHCRRSLWGSSGPDGLRPSDVPM